MRRSLHPYDDFHSPRQRRRGQPLVYLDGATSKQKWSRPRISSSTSLGVGAPVPHRTGQNLVVIRVFSSRIVQECREMHNATTTNAAGVQQEQPDRDATTRHPHPDGQDRPGFDLGGARGETNTVGSNIIPGGPRGTAASGTNAVGRAAGYGDPSGSRPLGSEGNNGSAASSGPTEPGR